MLSFVQNLFGPRMNPIGIDFGSDCLRLAQIQVDGDHHKFFAGASAEVPAFAKEDFDSGLDFFAEAVPELLKQGKFKGRQAVLSLPASLMHIRHFRLPKMDDESLTQSLQQAARGKLPIDPANALMRHIVAGELEIHGKTMEEIILIAAAREEINKYLAAAAAASLSVVSMNVEPLALVDCFSHVHRRKIDEGVVSCYVDLGAGATRVTIGHGSHVLYAHAIPIGGNHLTQAVADAEEVSLEDARLMRLKLSAHESQNSGRDQRNVSPPELSTSDTDTRARRIALACAPTATHLSNEIGHCRRAHEQTFPGLPVDRLIFVGGEASNRSLCQQIARDLNLPAQIGDPLVRMARTNDIPIESGIDRRLPQPAWSVAIGLSFAAPRHIDAPLHVPSRATAGAAR